MRECDLEILLKPHPEFDVAPFRTLAESHGAKLIEERFEEQIHLADAFVITHPMTSTVKFGLENKLPMIVIEFGFTRWFPEMKEKLKNNIQFVEGFIDEDFGLGYDREEFAAML